jgi:hypothetical protein
MTNNESPPDSDLLGLYVAGIAGLAIIAILVAFFLIGPVAGIIVLIAIGVIGGYLAYRRFGTGGDAG